MATKIIDYLTHCGNRHYENVPFEIPESWVWTTVKDICSKIGSGSTPRGSNYSPVGIPFFRSQNVYDNGLVYDDIKYISPEVHASMSGTEVRANDVLLNITGGSLGRCAVVPSDFVIGNVSQHVCILRPVCVLPEFLHFFCLSPFFSKTMVISGSGREGLPKYSIEKMLIPIPPLPEQERIVKDIEKWLSLIDEIDTNEVELNNAIQQTKSKILELALQGKLVEQDCNDEPAIELLRRINPNFTPSDNPHYGNLPSNWCETSMEMLCKSITTRNYQIKQSEINEAGKYPVVSQSVNYIEGYSDNDGRLLKVSSPVVIFGDHTRIVKYIDFDFIVGADGVKILQPCISPKFFYYLTLYVASKIKDRGYGRHYGYLSEYVVPIPPQKEQERIIDKIEELLKIMNEITEEL